jgi:WXXGXW repeat (2 copies)
MSESRISYYLQASVLAIALCLSPLAGRAQFEFSITIGPPPLPVYEQPPVPGPGYLWVPGYWSYGPYGYFWVPGTWLQPPEVGLLWTPGYWAWSDGFFVWNTGYWAPEVGFYGGVAYGFGYPGRGYEGGYWRDRDFYYNREVTNVTNVEIHNVYSKTVVNNTIVNNRVSYVGGPGGLAARPTPQEEAVARGRHVAPTSAQVRHVESAATNNSLLASVNRGKPAVAAVRTPGQFTEGAVPASRAGGSTYVHAQELPKMTTPPRPPQSATDQQREYERQQAALVERQAQERTSLTQMQQRDHAYLTQQQGENQRALAAMELHHQQQTEQMMRRQTSELQNIPKPPPQPTNAREAHH